MDSPPASGRNRTVCDGVSHGVAVCPPAPVAVFGPAHVPKILDAGPRGARPLLPGLGRQETTLHVRNEVVSMKVNLVVAEGVHQGKVIPIKLAQFVIGRDPQCHLRPSSASISKRHCVLLVDANKVMLRDLDSTNGTFVNDEPLKGQVEVHHADRLKIGPLLFTLQVERTPSVATPTPMPATVVPAEEDPDAAFADMLLEGSGEGDGSAPAASAGSADSTVLDMAAVPENPELQQKPEKPINTFYRPGGGKEKAKADANTSQAAKNILDKYLRRPRT
jgi:pSer/pThr/pTyr-binding forkhead associated (FHA) protein